MKSHRSYPLIEIVNESLKINFDTVSLLKESKVLDFTPIAIVGNLLTGKSSLLNHLCQ